MSAVLEEILKPGEEKITEWTSNMLDAAINGDFKTVKMYAKKIRQQAIKDKLAIHN